MKRVALLLALAGCSAETTATSWSVVRLENGCSAVVISKTHVATAAHCLSEVEPGQPDLAVVELRTGLPPVRIAAHIPEFQETVTVVGECGGAREHRFLSEAAPGEFDTAGFACPGDSGGGVFNAEGELVSIIRGYVGERRLRSTDAALLEVP